MKKEFDAMLCQRYSLIIAERSRSIQESCMGWGFLCGDGWFDLIDTLCERLQFWTDHNKAPQVIAKQVKQKWGTLCFYVRDANEHQLGMIAMAEAMSARVCETCGKPGRIVVAGAYMARCPEHSPIDAVTREVFEATLASKNAGLTPGAEL